MLVNIFMSNESLKKRQNKNTNTTPVEKFEVLRYEQNDIHECLELIENTSYTSNKEDLYEKRDKYKNSISNVVKENYYKKMFKANLSALTDGADIQNYCINNGLVYEKDKKDQLKKVQQIHRKQIVNHFVRDIEKMMKIMKKIRSEGKYGKHFKRYYDFLKENIIEESISHEKISKKLNNLINNNPEKLKKLIELTSEYHLAKFSFKIANNLLLAPENKSIKLATIKVLNNDVKLDLCFCNLSNPTTFGFNHKGKIRMRINAESDKTLFHELSHSYEDKFKEKEFLSILDKAHNKVLYTKETKNIYFKDRSQKNKISEVLIFLSGKSGKSKQKNNSIINEEDAGLKMLEIFNSVTNDSCKIYDSKKFGQELLQDTKKELNSMLQNNESIRNYIPGAYIKNIAIFRAIKNKILQLNPVSPKEKIENDKKKNNYKHIKPELVTSLSMLDENIDKYEKIIKQLNAVNKDYHGSGYKEEEMLVRRVEEVTYQGKKTTEGMDGNYRSKKLIDFDQKISKITEKDYKLELSRLKEMSEKKIYKNEFTTLDKRVKNESHSDKRNEFTTKVSNKIDNYTKSVY